MLTGLSINGLAELAADAKGYQDSGAVYFTIATNRKYTRKDGIEVENPTTFSVATFGTLAQQCASLKKGDMIYLVGDMDQRSYTDKTTGQERKSYQITARLVAPVGVSAHTAEDPCGDEPF